jgi:hypothetical protein
MPVLSTYGTPAFWNDFAPQSQQQQLLDSAWNDEAEGWIQQAILGNPWNATNSAYQNWFYDPTQTEIPAGTAAAQVAWSAFPGRIAYYLGNGSQDPTNPYSYSSQDQLSLADTGFDTKGNSFPPIPATRCPEPVWSGQLIPYGPYGPRGWLDEYCEWSVTRDGNGNIVRVDFVCENPEYWHTLWGISPETVQARYQEVLNYDVPAGRQISVALEDLYLFDADGFPVIDPSTGQPAYNPLNKWNSGTTSVRTGNPSTFSGGAIHLTSSPNTLQTELAGLAAASTVQRTIGNGDPQALICCGQYGQNFRNSDPHIGQAINQFVSEIPATICLADPLGLYLQLPDTSGWSFVPGIVPGKDVPLGAVAGDVFQVVRGYASLVDPVTGQPFPSVGTGPGAFVLHAVCQIPSAWLEFNPLLTLSDISISANIPSIAWGGQIAQQFQVGLYGRPLTQGTPPPVFPCVGSPTTPTPQPLQLFYSNLFDAYYSIPEPSPVTPLPAFPTAIPLASNTTITPPSIGIGTSGAFALPYTPTNNPGVPTVQFSTPDGTAVDPTIVATVTSTTVGTATYTVPGNSYPSQNALVYLTITTAANTQPGIRGVQIVDAGATPPQPPVFMPALLSVV